MTPKNLANAFKKCGIIPLNCDAVDEDWFKPSTSFNVTQTDQRLKDIPLQDSSQSNERMNKRKKIGGNAITEGDIHDYIMDREEERIDKRDKRRRRNEESQTITIEHDGLSVVITEEAEEKELHPTLNSDKSLWNKENEIKKDILQKKVKSKKQGKSI